MFAVYRTILETRNNQALTFKPYVYRGKGYDIMPWAIMRKKPHKRKDRVNAR